jgi:hypothetical protein
LIVDIDVAVVVIPHAVAVKMDIMMMVAIIVDILSKDDDSWRRYTNQKGCEAVQS